MHVIQILFCHSTITTLIKFHSKKEKKSSLQLLNQDCVTCSWPLLEQQCVGIIAMVKVFNWIKGEPKHFAISP